MTQGKNISRLTGVIFDLDGTLGETLPLCVEAFRVAVAPVTGRPLSDDEIYARFGPTEEGMIRALVPGGADEYVEAYLRHYEAGHDVCPAPFDGIAELLSDLRAKGVRLGLVTGKGARSTQVTLRRFGLDGRFEDVETGSDEGPCKPECISRIVERWRVDPSGVAYVGDAPSDVTAARLAGVGALSAAWADTSDAEALARSEPDALLLTVADLGSWLAPRVTGSSRNV